VCVQDAVVHVVSADARRVGLADATDPEHAGEDRDRNQ
jgi:hypothetical protein